MAAAGPGRRRGGRADSPGLRATRRGRSSRSPASRCVVLGGQARRETQRWSLLRARSSHQRRRRSSDPVCPPGVTGLAPRAWPHSTPSSDVAAACDVAEIAAKERPTDPEALLRVCTPRTKTGRGRRPAGPFLTSQGAIEWQSDCETGADPSEDPPWHVRLVSARLRSAQSPALFTLNPFSSRRRA
jgi:hypothetical protein